MLVIRLFRVGKKNQPSFKIVVTDKRKPARGGLFVEQVGFWNPVTKEKVLKQDRVKYWLSVGAKPSPTIHNMLVSEKIVEAKKIPVHKKPKKAEPKQEPQPPQEPPKEAVPAAEPEKPAEEKPAEQKQVKEKQAEESPKPEQT